MPTEKEMMKQLRTGKVSLPPIQFRLLKEGPKRGTDYRFDAFVEASWGNKKARFVLECKALSTPKVFRDGVNMLKTSLIPKGMGAMLFVPYLNDRQLEELEKENISGIDLCGNGVVIVPETFSVFRNGGKNRFPYSAPIKNVYRKNSSMVGRALLLVPEFDAVQSICKEVNLRNQLVAQWKKKEMSISTVSKVLKTLEEDLIISRGDSTRLLQPEKLLQKLSENYTPPEIKNRVRMKVSEGTLAELLWKESQRLAMPFVATGVSSVGRYAVMQRGDMVSAYCPRLERLLENLSGNLSDRFPNLELLETEDETVFFDSRQEEGFWWASPIQVYLELMAGDKRDQETAEQLKSYIISKLPKVNS